MPSCSTAKHPNGTEITFVEETHEYSSIINNEKIVYTSGTSFVHKFFPEFDEDGSITKRCALKEGITVEAIKKKWKDKADESCRLGTRTHEMCEDIFLDRDYRNVAENSDELKRFANAIKISKKIKTRLDIVGVEKIVFDPSLKIAGTIDFLGKSKTQENLYVIIDHKTNKHIDLVNKFNKFGLPPIDDIPDTNFWHYTLQLNLYEYILKYGGYVDPNAEFKLFLNHITTDSVTLIPVEQKQELIEKLLKVKV